MFLRTKLTDNASPVTSPPSFAETLQKRKGPDFADLGMQKLCDLRIGARHKLEMRGDTPLPPPSYSNDPMRFRRILYWQHPRPKQPIRTLARELAAFRTELSFAPHEYVAEHAEPGIAVGTIFDLLNRSEVNLAEWAQVFSDAVILTVNPTTTTPFLLRSIIPRSRLIVVGSVIDVETCDIHIPLTPDTPTSAQDVAAAIKHLVQTNTDRTSHAVNTLKGTVPADFIPSPDDLKRITFLVPKDADLPARPRFCDILHDLYERSTAILVPNAIRLAQERLFHGTATDHRTLLAKMLDTGIRATVVRI